MQKSGLLISVMAPNTKPPLISVMKAMSCHLEVLAKYDQGNRKCLIPKNMGSRFLRACILEYHRNGVVCMEIGFRGSPMPLSPKIR